MAIKAKDQRDGDGERTRTVGKRRKLPVKDGLRSSPERKPIILNTYYAALKNTESLEHENDHLMIKIQLQGERQTVRMNAMIDSGATEDFIDKEVCSKHGIKMIQAKKVREIYLADGKPSAMGPVTHTTSVPMDISSHRELASFQVANLRNHEVILGMPWLQKHSPRIDWNDKKITFDSERCTSHSLKSSPVVTCIHVPEAVYRSGVQDLLCLVLIS